MRRTIAHTPQADLAETSRDILRRLAVEPRIRTRLEFDMRRQSIGAAWLDVVEPPLDADPPHFPQFRLLDMAEDVTHNIRTIASMISSTYANDRVCLPSP